MGIGKPHPPVSISLELIKHKCSVSRTGDDEGADHQEEEIGPLVFKNFSKIALYTLDLYISAVFHRLAHSRARSMSKTKEDMSKTKEDVRTIVEPDIKVKSLFST